MSNTTTPGSCFLYLQEQHCARNVLNWVQLLKLNLESPDFALIHGFCVQWDPIAALGVGLLLGALNVL